MAKITLNTLGNLDNPNSFLTQLNENFSLIASQMEEQLSRDGTAPNPMKDNLDMDFNRIVNLPEPQSPTEAARNVDLQQYVDDAVAAKEAAELAEVNAETAEDGAQDLYTSIQARYLGGLSSDPTTDLNGAPLEEGALYYDTNNHELNYYSEAEGWRDVSTVTLNSLSDIDTDGIQNGQYLGWSEADLSYKAYSLPSYDIAFFARGLLTANETVFQLVFTRPVVFLADLPGSVAYVDQQPASGQTLDLYKNGVSIGSIVYTSGSNQGSFTFASDVEFEVGDRFSIEIPGLPDTAAKDFSITISGQRND